VYITDPSAHHSLLTAHQLPSSTPLTDSIQQLRTSTTRHNFITMCRSYPQSSGRQPKVENKPASPHPASYHSYHSYPSSSSSASTASTIFSSATSTTAQTSRSASSASSTPGGSTPQQGSGSTSPTGSNFSKSPKSFDYSVKHSYGKGYAYQPGN